MVNKDHSLRDIVETTWRTKYGTPQLCSYKEGR